jgi:transcriptional regulator with XRE-family HTH domain
MLLVTDLAERLRIYRRRHAWTQGELAEKAGVGITTIARIETRDITDPRVSTVRKLADALGITPEDLMNND